MEEGKILLLMEGVPEMPPLAVGGKEVLLLPVLVVTEDIPEEQEHHELQEEQPGAEQTVAPMPRPQLALIFLL